MYNIKLLELVAISNVNEKSYLHIRLSTEDEIEFFWSIDNSTAKIFESIFEDDGHHRYRISLSSTYDIAREQCISSITKTYRDISETVFFDCSLQYQSDLDAIKNSQNITELINLPFIFSHLPNSNSVGLHEPINNRNRNMSVKRITATFSSLLALIGLIIVIYAFPKHQIVNKTIIESTLVTAAQQQPQAKITPINSKIMETKEDESNTTTSVDTFIDNASTFSLPYFTIENPITYSIAKDYVALTFDDGPSKYTKKITDVLKQYNVGGTFFFLGNNAKKHPDAVQYVYENGYSIGTHSMSHPDLTQLTSEQYENEILQSVKVIENITNHKVTLFRPPYGAKNEQIIEYVNNQQLKTVLWNKDPKDWNTKKAQNITGYIRENKVSGSIIILHESQTVIDALPEIIEYLQKQNLQIVNLQ